MTDPDSDSAVYLPDSVTVPKTHMDADQAHELVRMLSTMPSNVGFIISHVIEPPHTPGIFGGYHSTVILPNGGNGEANANNPCIAFRRAWAKAHADQAVQLI